MEFLEVTSERCEVFTEANVNSVDRTFNNGRLVKGAFYPIQSDVGTDGVYHWAVSYTHLDVYKRQLKNPAALAISLNGTSQGAYDGSVAKSVNITPAGIGALGRTEKAADSSKLAGLTPVIDNPGPSNRNTWYFPFTGTNNKDGTRKYYAAPVSYTHL